MAGIRRADWEDIIHETALNAADAWRKWVEGPGQTKSSDEAEKGVYEKIFNRLQDEYPYEGATMDTMVALNDYKPETVWRWVINGTTDPRKERAALEASKFLPYLMGNDKDWTKQSAKALQEMATNDLKYPYTKEGYAQFLRELGAQQLMADRAKLLDDMRGGADYYYLQAVTPSLVEEVENAVAEGRDVPAGTAAKLFGLDLATDAAIGLTPSLEAVKARPVLNSIVTGGLQGGEELLRQLAKTGVSENLVPDMAAPMMASTMGMTRPGMVGTTQAAASRFTGPEAQNFSRGVMKALKAGDPMDIEERRLRKTAERYNLINKQIGNWNGNWNGYVKNFLKYHSPSDELTRMRPMEEHALKQAVDDLTSMGNMEERALKQAVNVAEGNRNLATNRMPDMAKALGVTPEKDGTYDVAKLIGAYNRQPKYYQKLNRGKVENIYPPEYLVKDNPEVLWLTKDTEPLFKANFPAKYSYEDAESKARKAGYVIGSLLGDVGSRIEPMIKANPLNGLGRDFVRPYKKEAWYRKLDAEQRKVIDDAMKKKEEEE